MAEDGADREGSQQPGRFLRASSLDRIELDQTKPKSWPGSALVQPTAQRACGQIAVAAPGGPCLPVRRRGAVPPFEQPRCRRPIDATACSVTCRVPQAVTRYRQRCGSTWLMLQLLVWNQRSGRVRKRSDDCRCIRSTHRAGPRNSGFQRRLADLMTAAALPPEAAGRPVEIWLTDQLLTERAQML